MINSEKNSILLSIYIYIYMYVTYVHSTFYFFIYIKSINFLLRRIASDAFVYPQSFLL
jgi:hypothetical protein